MYKKQAQGGCGNKGWYAKREIPVGKKTTVSYQGGKGHSHLEAQSREGKNQHNKGGQKGRSTTVRGGDMAKPPQNEKKREPGSLESNFL